MLRNVVMPKLGESVTEGTVVKWLVKPGDIVKQYDNLLEVETAKVVAEVPSTDAGIIKEILVKEGDTVAVGVAICVMEVTANIANSADKELKEDAKTAAGLQTTANNSLEGNDNSVLSKNEPSKNDTNEYKNIPHQTQSSILSSSTGANNYNGLKSAKITTNHLVSGLNNNFVNNNSKSEATNIGTTKVDAVKGRYSPAVLSLAQEHNIDLAKIKGTGFEGRITRKDILAIIANGEVNSNTVNNTTTSDSMDNLALNTANSANTNTINPSSSVANLAKDSLEVNNIIKQSLATKAGGQDIDNVANISTQSGLTAVPVVANLNVLNTAATVLASGDKLLPLSAVRKAIAKKMVESVSNIPHAWLTVEVDATNLVNLRNKIKDGFLAKEGFPITYFAFFVLEIVKALQNFPLLNSVWQEDSILLKKAINISIAVAVGNNLFVPVIKNADSKNIKGIAKEIYELATKAKNNSLTLGDMQGGTFTVNNTGSFGSISSMGIINYPQAAILQVESIIKRPVVLNNNAIAIRDMVNLSLSIDHRIIDGLIAGNFLKAVKANIENISSEIV